MNQPSDFQNYFLNKLLPHGPVTSRRMFGGVGFFMNGVIFASIIDGELYFRVDEMTRSAFEKHSAKQFIHIAKGKQIPMPYFVVPEKVLEDPKTLSQWMEQAYQAALRNLAKKAKKKKR